MRAEEFFFCSSTTAEYRVRFGTSKMHLSPPPISEAWAAVRSKAVVLLVLIVTPIVEVLMIV